MNWNFFFHVGIISSLSCFQLLSEHGCFFQLSHSCADSRLMLLLVFYNFGAPAAYEAILGDMVYHLLNISFIAMLRTPKAKVKDHTSEPGGERQRSWPNMVFRRSSAVVTALLIAVYDKPVSAIGYTCLWALSLGRPGIFNRNGVGTMGFRSFIGRFDDGCDRISRRFFWRSDSH